IEEIDISYIISKRSLDSILSYKYNNNTTSPNPNNNPNTTNPNNITTTKNININKIFKKECEVFVRMVTNLYKYNPIDLEQLRYKVLEIKDRNIISQSTIDNYEYNRKLYFIKNKL
ncbi:Phospholipase A2 activating protein, partial [Spraguea lophii 42_110]